MRALHRPNTHHLSAAIGWLELGNPTEAKLELEKLTPAARQPPDVLEARWLICAEGKDWEAGGWSWGGEKVGAAGLAFPRWLFGPIWPRLPAGWPRLMRCAAWRAAG